MREGSHSPSHSGEYDGVDPRPGTAPGQPRGWGCFGQVGGGQLGGGRSFGSRAPVSADLSPPREDARDTPTEPVTDTIPFALYCVYVLVFCVLINPLGKDGI